MSPCHRPLPRCLQLRDAQRQRDELLVDLESQRHVNELDAQQKQEQQELLSKLKHAESSSLSQQAELETLRQSVGPGCVVNPSDL